MLGGLLAEVHAGVEGDVQTQRFRFFQHGDGLLAIDVEVLIVRVELDAPDALFHQTLQHPVVVGLHGVDAAEGADVVAVDGGGELVDGLALFDRGSDGQNNAFIYAELLHRLAQAVYRAVGVGVIGLVLDPQEAFLQDLDGLGGDLAGENVGMDVN